MIRVYQFGDKVAVNLPQPDGKPGPASYITPGAAWELARALIAIVQDPTIGTREIDT